MKKTSLAIGAVMLAGATGFGAILLNPAGQSQAGPVPESRTTTAPPEASAAGDADPCGCTGCQAMAELDEDLRSGTAAPAAGSVIVLDDEQKAAAPTDEQIRQAGGDVRRRGAIRDVTPAIKDDRIARIVEVDFIETRTVAVIGEDGQASLICEVDLNAGAGEESN